MKTYLALSYKMLKIIIDKYSSQEIMFYADAMHECLSLELPDSAKGIVWRP